LWGMAMPCWTLIILLGSTVCEARSHDAWIAASAVVKNAVLVHKDPEFTVLADLSQESLVR